LSDTEKNISGPAGLMKTAGMIFRIRSLILFLFILGIGSGAFGAKPIMMKSSDEGIDREALLFPPDVTNPAAKVPVIFVFHPHGNAPQQTAEMMHFQTDWPEALVIYMQGLPTPGLLGDAEGTYPGWQQTPGQLEDRDLKFFDIVLTAIRERYPVDDRRIYATGFSNGGFFTYLLWAKRPQIFAAFATGACTILPAVQITEPRAVFHAAGKNDLLALFADQEKTMAELRKLNGCSEQGESCATGCTLYPSTKGAPVETFIYPAGHSYPPEASELIVKFFKAQSLK
jgi:polyhydroxybutyrate depolymerase